MSSATPSLMDTPSLPPTKAHNRAVAHPSVPDDDPFHALVTASVRPVGRVAQCGPRGAEWVLPINGHTLEHHLNEALGNVLEADEVPRLVLVHLTVRQELGLRDEDHE
eukprot:10200243-Lingulodinium_polyedra.AAC.1